MEHKNTDNSELNYSLLESRILSVNDNNYSKINDITEMLNNINDSTLIMATGGSKVVANYLDLIIQSKNIISEVIEPRDFVYKRNANSYSNLIVISSSGKSNGIEYALNNFKGNKVLLTQSLWSNELYSKERSFISLAESICPMTILLDYVEGVSRDKLDLINEKIIYLLHKSKDKIGKLDYDFKDKNVLEILSGYDTRTSSYILESNMVETGTIPVVIHDKGAFCHGRSNLMFNYRDNPVLYLSHNNKELDKLLISLLNKEYNNVLLFDTFDLEDDIFFKEYYLSLQMYYLSRYISECKNIDVTMPEYNPNIVKKVYKYRGEM